MHRRLMLALALTVLLAADVGARISVPVPLKWVFKQHDVVFIGRVHEPTLFGERTIEITDGLKNARAGETVTIRLPNECCPNFSRGDMPLVKDPTRTIAWTLDGVTVSAPSEGVPKCKAN